MINHPDQAMNNALGHIFKETDHIVRSRSNKVTNKPKMFIKYQGGGGGRVRKSASVMLTSQNLYNFRPARAFITSECHSTDD